MNTPCLMQLLQVKINGHLLEGGRLSNCAGDFIWIVEEEAGFYSICEDLAHMEETDLALDAIGGVDVHEAEDNSQADETSAGEDGADSELDLFEWCEAAGAHPCAGTAAPHEYLERQREAWRGRGGPGQFLSTCVCQL
jgi:hypothetical protein